MHFGWTSPAVPKLLKTDSILPITKDQSNWITQWYLVGNIMGVFISFAMFNKLSRKLSISIASVPIAIGWVGNLFVPSVITLYAMRFIAGIGKSMMYVAVPMYIGEIAHPKIRAILVSFVYVMMNIGVLLVYSITPFTPLYVPAVVGLIITFVHVTLLHFVPESPYYLLMKHDTAAARKSLQILRYTEDVEEELNTISAAVKRQTSGGISFKNSVIQLFSEKNNLKALGIVLTLRALQMFSGISVMVMHIHTIFDQSDGKWPPDMIALVFPIMLFISCLISLVTADRFGRKSLMIFSSCVTAVVLASQGTFYYVKLKTNLNVKIFGWLPVFNIVSFVFAYRIGLGTIPLVMVSELFQANVKVPGVVLADFVISISSFLSNLLFHYTEDILGIFMPFWVFSSLCLISAIFSLFFVPQTQGKSLEEIQQLLMYKKYAKKKCSEDIC